MNDDLVASVRLISKFIMSNFYCEEEAPLRRVRVYTYGKETMLTQPPKLPKLNFSRGNSPLTAVTKLVLGELERPLYVLK